MASGGHVFDCVPVLTMDCAPQHHWFNIVYVVSANGGKRLNLRLYAGLRQALGFYYQSLQQLGVGSWWRYCGEEEPSHLLCDSPCSPERLPGIRIWQCSLHHIIRSHKLSTTAHTSFLVVRVSNCVFPNACLSYVKTYIGKMHLIQLVCTLDEDKRQIGKVLFKDL